MKKEYTQEDIEEIIFSGTTKEKATLFLRDRMGYFKYGIPFLLNIGEPEVLMDSVCPYELQEWNKYISWGLRIENGFKDLNRFLMILMTYRDDLSKILSEMSDLEGIEEAVNETLLMSSLHNDLDPSDQAESQLLRDLRVIAIKQGFSNKHFNKIRPEITEDGYISFIPEVNDLNLFGEKNEFRSIKERAMSTYLYYKDWMMKYLCFEEAMRRRIKESKLKLPEYEKLLTAYRVGLDSIKQEPHSLRYEGFQDVRLVLFGRDSRSGKMFPYPAMIDLIEDLSVRSDEFDINSDESEKKIMSYYDSI